MKIFSFFHKREIKKKVSENRNVYNLKIISSIIRFNKKVRRELNVSIYRKFFFLHLSSSVREKRSTIRPSLFKAKGMKAEKSAGFLNF
jgi:hypothetical protein